MKKIYLVLFCAVGLWAALSETEKEDLYAKCSIYKDEKACKRLISNGVPNSSACDKSDCSKVGTMYRTLNAVQKASGFYRRACELGDARGCGLLGDMYVENKGFDKNATMAVRYWDRGCALLNLNDTASISLCQRLAQGYYQGDKNGIKKDFAKAKGYYEKLCDFDNTWLIPSACLRLATMHYKGQGTKKDFFKAFELFEKLCDTDMGESCANLADMYDKGEGTRQNLILAKKYYGKACDLRVQKGCANYTRLNEKGVEDINEEVKEFKEVNENSENAEEKGFLESVKGLWNSLF